MKVADLEIRPATLDDAALVADVETNVHPDDAVDPKLLRHWWSMDSTEGVTERFVGLRDGAVVAHAYRMHPSWEKMPERYCRIGGEIRSDLRSAERFGALVAMLEDRSRADGSKKLTIWAWERDRFRREALEAAGYREVRRQRFWELDLRGNRDNLERMARESREQMRKDGIRILTLADDHDPAKFDKLKRMSDEAERDVPSTVPFVPVPFDDWIKWFSSPGLRPDRIWIARAGEGAQGVGAPGRGAEREATEDIVGISMLSYPPVRGVVVTDWTGTARKVRGRGVARALKCETVMQAIALGVDRVRTDNDSRNAPILHINETMGYRIRAEMVQYLKEV
jgi:hypothetical protein